MALVTRSVLFDLLIARREFDKASREFRPPRRATQLSGHTDFSENEESVEAEFSGMTKKYDLGPVEVSLTPQQQFAQFLQSKGKRVTSQRQLIVEQVFSHHDHFDADELMTHLQDLIAERKVSRPTVYRTLTELTEAGLIRKMMFEDRSVYEHDYGYPRHDHLHCQVCDQLIEFQSEELDQLVKKVAGKCRFAVQSHRLFVQGVCEECQEKKAKKNG